MAASVGPFCGLAGAEQFRVDVHSGSFDVGERGLRTKAAVNSVFEIGAQLVIVC